MSVSVVAAAAVVVVYELQMTETIATQRACYAIKKKNVDQVLLHAISVKYGGKAW